MACPVALLLTFVPFGLLALLNFGTDRMIERLGGARPFSTYMLTAATGFAGLGYALYLDCL